VPPPHWTQFGADPCLQAIWTDLPGQYRSSLYLYLYLCDNGLTLYSAKAIIMPHRTRSVAAGLGRHGMPPPACNDTGTADWSRDLATLAFDLGVHGACSWCVSSSFARVLSLKFIDIAIRKIWRTMCVSINGPGDLDLWPFDLETERIIPNLGTLCLRVLELFAMYATDGRTDGQKQRLLPLSYGWGIIIWSWYTGRWWLRYTKCNSPLINGQCTNHRIAE